MAAGRGQLVGAEEAAAERAREDASRANEMALAAAARDLAAGHVACRVSTTNAWWEAGTTAAAAQTAEAATVGTAGTAGTAGTVVVVT